MNTSPATGTTTTTSTARDPLGAAIRNGLLAGVIAAVIRVAFALTLENMTMGQAAVQAVLYFLGTTIVATLIAYLITRGRATR